MKHRVLLYCVFVLLVGCNDASDDVRGVGADLTSSTAVYFPGGAGVDFGRKPTKDEVIENQREHGSVFTRIVTYELEHDYVSIDKQLTEVLGQEGYVRTQVPTTKKDRLADIRYSKGSRGVMAYYKETLEGLRKKTILVLYWRQ